MLQLIWLLQSVGATCEVLRNLTGLKEASLYAIEPLSETSQVVLLIKFCAPASAPSVPVPWQESSGLVSWRFQCG